MLDETCLLLQAKLQIRQEQLDKGILATLDDAYLRVAKVTDEVRTARQRNTGYSG